MIFSRSFAARRDVASVEILLKDAGSQEEVLRTAAMEAPARIGDARAVPLIKAAARRGSQRARARAENALLVLQESLAGARRR